MPWIPLLSPHVLASASVGITSKRGFVLCCHRVAPRAWTLDALTFTLTANVLEGQITSLHAPSLCWTVF